MHDVLNRLGLQAVNSGVCSGDWLPRPSVGEILSYNPATGEPLARVLTASRADYDHVIERATAAFQSWRNVPAPARGEVIRQLGVALREKKDDLGLLVTLEAGKVLSEGRGEIQEMIDMCDFAVGLSRQLHGLTIATERPQHRMFEQWHPLGAIGIIKAFNFPVAVWAWNAALAAVCGDTMIWKPSPVTPLTAIAVQHIVNQPGQPQPVGLILGWRIRNLCKSPDHWGSSWAGDYANPLALIHALNAGKRQRISHLHYSGDWPDGSKQIDVLLDTFRERNQWNRHAAIHGLRHALGINQMSKTIRKVRKRLGC